MHGIAQDDMTRYRQGAIAREAVRREALERRRERAWILARRAARLLRDQFGATRVVVFGSLAYGDWFHARSDIDLAVKGLASEAFWQAGSALDHLDPGFEFDLIAVETAPERLREEIGRGVEV